MIAWWENVDGGGVVWTERTIESGFDGARNLVLADVDSDGDLDVAAVGKVIDQLAWWENIVGNGSVWAQRVVGVGDGAHALAAADIDSDGDVDLAMAAVDEDAVRWFENVDGGGLTWTEHDVDSTFGGARGLALGDVDRDGDLDLAATGRDADEVRWYENLDGAGGSWTPRTITATFLGPLGVALADLDADGDLDVLAAGVLEDEIAWWENDSGDGSSWIERRVEALIEAPFAVAVGDVDADGDPDVVGALFNDDSVLWWSNESVHGSAYFADATLIDPDAVSVTEVAVADLDADGDPDLVAAGGGNTDNVRWWENADGLGLVWLGRVIGTGDNPDGLEVQDVDGDGDLDVVSGLGRRRPRRVVGESRRRRADLDRTSGRLALCRRAGHRGRRHRWRRRPGHRRHLPS